VLALIFTGWKYSSRSWGYGEVSVNSPAGVPIYQFKSVLVAAGLLLAIQGLAEILRCIIAIRDNRWMTPEDDVVETEELLMRKAAEAETENHP
jgi:TRAP-type mannitol/chloroaromatic compound transport system permease small subunit